LTRAWEVLVSDDKTSGRANEYVGGGTGQGGGVGSWGQNVGGHVCEGCVGGAMAFLGGGWAGRVEGVVVRLRPRAGGKKGGRGPAGILN